MNGDARELGRGRKYAWGIRDGRRRTMMMGMREDYVVV
jgi:hypothetical protein